MHYTLGKHLNSSLSLPEHLTSWIPGKTPLSSTKAVAGCLLTYIVTVCSIQAVMMSQVEYSLKTLFRGYNLFISWASLFIFVLMVDGALPLIRDQGFIYSICSEEAWTSKLEFGYMVNYYFKYVELLDTVLLALRKKPISLLHVYHHCATIVIMYNGFGSQHSLIWALIMPNVLSHVFLYHYFYASAGGARIWWKKYLPWIQIMQFVVQLTLCLVWPYSRFVMPLAPGLPQIGTCAGDPLVGYVVVFTLSSYLVLFFNYYFKPLEYLEFLIVQAEIKDLIP